MARRSRHRAHAETLTAAIPGPFVANTREFATDLIRSGVDVGTVQELLGHADLQTIARYLHSDTRAKQVAVDKLNGLLGTEPSRPEPLPQPDTATEVSHALHPPDTPAV